tara:strand:+ start:154 stop:645 length:492 start_codon:yes stop_codon:yes gene_type:complete
MTTVQELAADARAFFEKAIRHGSGEEFWKADPSKRPDWVAAMIHAAHQDFGSLPDDYIYRLVVEALDWFEDMEGDYDELETSINEVEPDPSNAALVAWLGSHPARTTYVDDALEEAFANPVTSKRLPLRTYDLLWSGRFREIEYVYHVVLDALYARAKAVTVS